MDVIVRNIASKHSRQSDRSMLNINIFKIGIDPVKLTGNEKDCQLFVIWLSMIPINNKRLLISIEKKSPNKYFIVEKVDSNNRKINHRENIDKIIDNTVKFNY